MAKKGTPIVCQDCASERRYFALNRCESCYYKVRYLREQEKRKHYAQRYRKENPEKVLACNRKSYTGSELQRDNVRHYGLKSKYGMTRSDFQDMLDSQLGMCAICAEVVVPGIGQRNDAANVDHCHTTGVVRGILCSRCNRGLGMFRDNPDVMNRAISYLMEDRSGARFHASESLQRKKAAGAHRR